MSRLFSRKARRIYYIMAAVFLVLFLFRLGYGYTLKIESPGESNVTFGYFSNDSKKNYASNEYKSGMSETYQESAGIAVDQKYEKIAKINARSADFESDEEKLRKSIKENFGIIQYERKTGNVGKRQLQIQVGVPPANFDTLYAVLINIGVTEFKEIIKNDKTNEYLELNARKKSLDKTLNSLIEFKEKNGQIDEFINLENRILEIEKNLQQLGVNLGDFDESNEFCTIQFSLAEVKKTKPTTISFYHRIKVAFEWTVAYYFRMVGALFLIIGCTFFLLFAVDKGWSLKNRITEYFEKKKN